MHPVLFKIGDLAVPSYGAALAISFAVGIYLAMRRARARGLDGEVVLDVSLAIIVASIVGSRLFYIALHIEEFQAPHGSLWDVFIPVRSPEGRITLSGVSVLGALPASLLAAAAVLRFKRVPPLPYMDVMAPFVALGAAITRVGCFLNGCCFGTYCPWPLGVHYPPGSQAAQVFGNLAVHPAPLYHTAAGLLIFALLIAVDRGRPFDGAIITGLFALLGLQRFAIEFARFNDANWSWTLGPFSLNPYQLVALGLVLGGCLTAAQLRLRARTC